MAESDSRYTPQSVLDVVRSLAPIGLDPCAPASNPTEARIFFTEAEDGLAQTWLCRPGELVFVNPPYGRGELSRWASKVVESRGLEVLVLTPCDLGTRWARVLFQGGARALCGWHGRIAFVRPDGTYETGAKQPSLFWYFGARIDLFRMCFESRGSVAYIGGR